MIKNEHIAPRINAELAIINTWLAANKLYLNIDKTKYMIFSIKDKPPDLLLKIGNSCIQRVNVKKILGLYIDDRLSFGDHTSKICAKMSRSVGVIRRLSLLVPRDVLKQHFYAFIHSKFTYGIVCYGSAYQNQIQRLKNVINRALKLIFNPSVVTPDLLRRENILSFEMSYRYFCTIKMYKVLQLKNHESLAIKINSYQRLHPYETRNFVNERLTLPVFTLTKCQNSFIYRGIGFWNSIPIELRNIPNDLNSFKRHLKRLLLAQQ